MHKQTDHRVLALHSISFNEQTALDEEPESKITLS